MLDVIVMEQLLTAQTWHSNNQRRDQIAQGRFLPKRMAGSKLCTNMSLNRNPSAVRECRVSGEELRHERSSLSVK